jgi:hypothetical protein
MTLDALQCPECGKTLVSREGPIRPVQRFEHCLRRCDECQVGYSNSSSSPVQIWRDAGANVPAAVRDGIELALARAVNVVNRRNKRAKFGFGTSEDAVTWTVIRYFQTRGLLGDLIELTQHVAADPVEARVLLWGVEIPPPADASEAEAQLESASRTLGESSHMRTEPDALIELGSAGIVVIEAKHGSKNDHLSEDHPNWQRYLNVGFTDAVAVRHTGLYELTRNWRFGCELAAGRPFTLVNLGPSSLFGDQRLETWTRALDTSLGRRFVRLSWNQLLRRQHLEPWMAEFCRERGLLMP